MTAKWKTRTKLGVAFFAATTALGFVDGSMGSYGFTKAAHLNLNESEQPFLASPVLNRIGNKASKLGVDFGMTQLHAETLGAVTSLSLFGFGIVGEAAGGVGGALVGNCVYPAPQLDTNTPRGPQ